MARVTLPTYLPVSKGRMGDAVFYKRKGTQCMRSYVIPVNPDTEGQRECRGSFRDAVKAWHLITAEEKDVYKNRVIELNLNMSGFNLFISEYMKQT